MNARYETGAACASTRLAVAGDRIAQLDAALEDSWHELVAPSRFSTRIRSGTFDARLYAIYLIETYHYTLHNSRNQALAGARAFDREPQFLKFCFKHASEEVGHELLALHDLCSLGLERDTLVLPAPLPSTEVLIAYLYWISQTGNSVQRLGYSFWAERCYRFIGPLLQSARSRLRLQDSQMTFLVAHAQIDDAHGREVVETMERHCRDAADWECVARAMHTSLRLTAQVLDDVEAAFTQLASGRSRHYAFLSCLA